MYVDGYCERTAPGLWGEPFNSVSNVAFLAACVALLSLLARQRRPVPPSVWLLAAIVGVVGAVSLTLRTVDEPLCAQWPIGTHFLWHCLNATVLSLVRYAVISASAEK